MLGGVGLGLGSVPLADGGSGGGGIADGTTILGSGTSSDKFRVNPALFLGPDPLGYFSNLLQQKTGLSPLALWTVYDDFVDSNRSLTGANSRGFVTNGVGGSGVAYGTGGDSGTVVMTGPNAGGGFADWSLSPGGANFHIVNMRTKRWLLAYRVAIAHAPAAGSRLAFGLYGGTNMVGLGFGSASATWKYCRAVNNVTEIANTGFAIDSSGTQYLWFYLYNDGTNVRYCMDVLGGSAEAIAEASANLPSAAAYTYAWNEGTAGDVAKFDAYVFAVER